MIHVMRACLAVAVAAGWLSFFRGGGVIYAGGAIVCTVSLWFWCR